MSASFHEVSIAIRAENRTMGAFRMVASDVLHLGMAFGALDSQTGRTIMQIFSVIRLMTSLKAILATTTVAQHAQNAAVGTQIGVLWTATTAQTAHNAATTTGIASQIAHRVALIATSAAHAIHAAGAWIATAAQNALNISYATFLALTGVGILVIIAAAAAMWYFASQMNAATASVKGYNAAVSEMPSSSRSLRRAGEEESLRNRGIEF